MRDLRRMMQPRIGFPVALSLVALTLAGAQTAQAAPRDVARLAGPWQAALVWSGSGCGPMTGVVNFNLDKTGVDHSATLRTHSAGCPNSTSTELVRIDSLNADGSGMASLTCNNQVGCGWVLTIQVDRTGRIFNLADIAAQNPGNFVAGTAIKQRKARHGDDDDDDDE